MIDVNEHFTLEEAQFSESRKMELINLSTVQAVQYESEYSYLADSRNINDYFEINSIRIQPSKQQKTIIFYEEASNQNSQINRNLSSSRLQSSRRKIATFNQPKHPKMTLQQPIRLPLTPRFLTFQLHSDSQQLCVGILRQTQNVGEAPFFNGRGIKKGILSYKVNQRDKQQQNISLESDNFDESIGTLTSEDFYGPKQTIICSNLNNEQKGSYDKSKRHQNHAHNKDQFHLQSGFESQRESQSEFRDTASFLIEADSLISKLNKNKHQSKKHISQKNSQTLEESMFSSIRSKRITFAAIQDKNVQKCVQIEGNRRKPGFIKTQRRYSRQQQRISPLLLALKERHKFPSIMSKYPSKIRPPSLHKLPRKSISEVYINKSSNQQKYNPQKESFNLQTQSLLSLEYFNKIDVVVTHLSIIFQICHFDKKYVELMLPPNIYKTSSQFGNHLAWTNRIYLFKTVNISDYILMTVKTDSKGGNSTLGRAVISIIDLLRHQQQSQFQTALKDTNSRVAKVYLQFQLYKSSSKNYQQFDETNRTKANSKVSNSAEYKVNPEITKKIKNEKAKERILEKYIRDSKIQKLVCPKLNPNQTRRYTGGNIKIGKAKRVTTEAIKVAPGPGEYNLPSTFSKHSSKQI